MSGEIKVNGTVEAREAELVVLDLKGDRVRIQAVGGDALILVMAGEPIREPIARYGPFVMNTRQELVQAVDDYRAGKMGHLS